MRKALIISLVFHLALVIVTIVGMPLFRSHADAEPSVQVLNVDLVQLAELTQAPPAPPKRPEPPKAPEKAPEPVPEPVREEPKPTPPPPAPEPPAPTPAPPPPAPPPEPAPPPPPPPQEAKAPEPAPTPPPTPPPSAKPTPPRPPAPAPQQPPKAETPPKKQEEPDPFASLLASVDAMREQPTRPTEQSAAAPQQAARPTASEPSPIRGAPVGEQATLSEKDFVRAQIERCWNIPAGARDVQDMAVRLRVRVNPDGTVVSSEILDRARMADPHFRAVAESAQRAPLVCSPLQLPQGRADIFREMELTFRPSEVIR